MKFYKEENSRTSELVERGKRAGSMVNAQQALDAERLRLREVRKALARLNKKERMKTSEKLLLRLREELGLEIPEDSKPTRVYAGYWQRTEGAWSWSVEGQEQVIGSQFSMAEVVKFPVLVAHCEHFGQLTVDPS